VGADLASIPRPGTRRAYWIREALARDPGAPCPPLAEDTTADVVVLGGGYTGLWTAFFATELDPSSRVVVLEQDICGGGPSGRNGGFVTAWWDELPALVDMYGREGALDACWAVSESVSAIGEWCERYGVDAWYSKRGYLSVSSNPAQDDGWRGAVELAEQLGVGDRYRELSPEEVQARCSSPAFRGGALMSDGATVQPARLARGMRRVLLERGVRIFEGSPVRRFRAPRHAGSVEAETPGGIVRAEQAVLGLNAWAGALKEFRRSLVTWGSYIVLTAPVPELLERVGWTGGECISDGRTAVRYFRTTPDGRIAMGGGGGRAGAAGRVGLVFTHDLESAHRAAEGLWMFFPSFREVPLDDAWGGPIDVSGTHLPYFGTLEPGNVHFAQGYTGNGVGPSHLAGRVLAALALGRDDPVTRLPMVGAKPKRFPPEPILSLGTWVVRESIVHKERSEEKGRRPNPAANLVAGIPRRLGYRLGPEGRYKASSGQVGRHS
jgi:glycine/D-amino acid oxidase-like deaminating enzyme